jgi:hypothetical protein
MRWEGHVAHMGIIINTYKLFAGFEERDHMEDRSADRGIILKQI